MKNKNYLKIILNDHFISRLILVSLFLFLTSTVVAQVFIPFGNWGNKKNITVSCLSGCYPTPLVQWTTAGTYYVPTGAGATFSATSVSNPSNTDFCFGPTNAGGCAADAFGGGTIYPLACVGGSNMPIDGSSTDEQAVVAPTATATGTDTCNVTDYNEARATKAFTVQAFTPVTITSPITTIISPQNVCVSQVQALSGAGGLGTKTWAITTGAGTLSSTTGSPINYTAPGTAQSVQVKLTDPTTSMDATVYISVVSTVALTPTGPIETPVNSAVAASLVNPGGNINYVANLDMRANCGLANYTCGVTGGNSAVTPTSGIANNATVRYLPASSDSTSTVTFTDSTPQVATITIKNIVPVDIVSKWYHTCAKYSHSTYAAGTYKIKCWGLSTTGQIGVGVGTGSRGDGATELGIGLLFVKDTGTTGADMLIKEMAVGFNHTCVILSNDAVKCWGGNASGQLGYDNTTTLTSPSASMVNIGVGTPSKIYAGYLRTCVIFSDDRIKCWGSNANGQLGQDNVLNYGSNATTAAMSGLGYINIAGSVATVQKVALSERNTCVLTTSAFAPGASSVYCWGFGVTSGTSPFGCSSTNGTYCGELGFVSTLGHWGTGTNLMSALTAINLGLGGGEAAIDIAAGRRHFCVLIVVTPAIAGTVKCWGYNSNGQLGRDSGTSDFNTPALVNTITTATSLQMMGRSSCAVLTGNNTKCWGRGSTNGQLLQGNTTNYGGTNAMSAIPGNMNFGTGLTVKKFSAGYYYGCAILSNDFIKCWGNTNCDNSAAGTKGGCLLSGATTSTNFGTAAGSVGDNLKYINH